MRERRLQRLKLQKARRNRKIAVIISAVILITVIAIACNKFIATASRPQTYKYYTEIRIHRNDTLWDIANRYRTEEYVSVGDYINEVKQINSICDNEIYYGQKLMIPYYSEDVK